MNKGATKMRFRSNRWLGAITHEGPVFAPFWGVIATDGQRSWSMRCASQAEAKGIARRMSRAACTEGDLYTAGFGPL